jgi:hypothetical protein
MTKYDDSLSPFIGAMERRSLLKLFGRSAIAIAGSAAPGLPGRAPSNYRNRRSTG